VKLPRPLLASLAVLAACSASQPGTPAETTRTPTTSARASRNPAGVFVFAVKGDWGAGTRAQQEVTAQMCSVRKRIPFQYVVTTGDNFYSPDGSATQNNFYGPERCLIDYPGNTWRAAWGNHDLSGPSTGAVLGSPYRYYTWSVGTTQFFMLDANNSGSAIQRAWLDRALRASRAHVKIVVFHQPAFTSGLHPDNISAQRNWVPLFVRYHVTLVLAGHNHDYEHLKVDGIDYVVTGGGGQSSYPCLRAEPGALRCVSAYHFLIVTVTSGSVTVLGIRSSGEELDRFEIRLLGA